MALRHPSHGQRRRARLRQLMGAYDERTLAIGGAVLGGDLGQGVHMV